MGFELLVLLSVAAVLPLLSWLLKERREVRCREVQLDFLNGVENASSIPPASCHCSEIQDPQAIMSVQLSKSIAKRGGSQKQSAETLAELLYEGLQPNLRGLAILVRDVHSQRITIAACKGLPVHRIKESLFVAFGRLAGSLSGGSTSGRQFLPMEPVHMDFKLFDVGTSTLVPLHDGDVLLGAIYLGFHRMSGGLSQKRRAFLQFVAEQASAAFTISGAIEQCQIMNNAEREYLLGLSHDLRTPSIRALYSISELGEELGAQSFRQRQLLVTAQEAIEQQLQLIDKVLAVSGAENGFMKAHLQNVGIQNLIGLIRLDVNELVEQSGNHFVCETDLEETVRVDPEHFRRIIHNFVSNAVKHTQSGEICVQVIATRGHVRFKVIDTGAGVPLPLRSSIFFESRTTSTDNRVEGTGLGLRICRVLAELNQGSVRYEPRIGGGSIFSLLLRRVEREKRCESDEVLAQTSVLIADDDVIGLRVLERSLHGSVGQLRRAKSIGDLRRAVEREESPGLIVSDLYFNDRSCWELLSRYSRKIPVVLVTGASHPIPFSTDNDRIVFVQKPFSPNALILAVKKVLHTGKNRPKLEYVPE